MNPCAISLASKKRFAKRIGDDLVRHYGKKKFYSTAMVRSSARRQNTNAAWDCWAYSLFTSPREFNEYHRTIGETCDYALMKGDMAAAVTDGASASWFDADVSWLDWPDFDLSSVFDLSVFDIVSF